MKRLIIALLLLIFSMSLSAQEEAFVDYRWEFGDLALRYPSNWEEPLQRFSTDGNQVMLMLAQNLVDSPDTRPPAIPFITVSLLRDVTPETELYPVLETALEDVSIRPVGALPTALFDAPAIASQGYSSDGLLYGMGRILYLDAERGALLITGRSAAGQRDSFVALFNSLANSITFTASQSTIAPKYGVLWHQAQSFVDGESAFLDIIGLSLNQDGSLYAADAIVGIIAFDSSTGIIENLIPYTEAIVPTAIASYENRVYLGDSLCTCIRIFENGQEVDRLTGFSSEAITSIAISSDGIVYATDELEGEILVRGNERIFRFDIPPFEAPLLTIDRLGRLLALVDDRAVYVLEEDSFVLQYELAANIFSTAIAIDNQNQLLVASETEGILAFNTAGDIVNRIGQVVEAEREAGDLSRPSGLAASADGTIYWAEGDGSFGNVTAVSLGVEEGRIGSINLRSGVEVAGRLTNTVNAQYWTFDGLRGDVVSLTALANDISANLDVTLRLLDPNGREIGAADNDETGFMLNFFDAQLNAVELPADGEYIVLIGRNAGEGAYRLGLSRSQSISLENGNTQVSGALTEAIPVQRWLIEGRSGQVVTITMQASSGDLDPVLFLLNARGEIVAENDDAEGFGFDSQIFEFALPATGEYWIEASRFSGDGNYRLEVESN